MIARRKEHGMLTNWMIILTLTVLSYSVQGTQYTSQNTRIVRKGDITDTRLAQNDKNILDVLAQHKRTGNTIAVHTAEHGLIVLASGGTDGEAHDTATEISTKGIAADGIGLCGLLGEMGATEVGDLIWRDRDRTGAPIEAMRTRLAKLRLDGLGEPTGEDYEQDLTLLRKLNSYAEDVGAEALREVYGQRRRNPVERGVVTADEGVAAWRQTYQVLISMDAVRLQRSWGKLLRILDRNNVVQDDKTFLGNFAVSVGLNGLVWLKRALHTEVQLQWLLRKKIITLESGKPILSSCRPCVSCANTAGVRHWCQEPSDTPFYCAEGDSGDHARDDTEMTKHAGLTQNRKPIYLVTLPK
jgi:hypothetical protein